MKYEDYEALTADLSADNAVDVVRQIMEQLKLDMVADEAIVAELNSKLEAMNDKYKALQIDYIQKFTSATGEETVDNDEDEIDVESEIEEIMKNI